MTLQITAPHVLAIALEDACESLHNHGAASRLIPVGLGPGNAMEAFYTGTPAMTPPF